MTATVREICVYSMRIEPQDAGLFMQAVPQAVKVVSPDRVLRSMPQLAGFQQQI